MKTFLRITVRSLRTEILGKKTLGILVLAAMFSSGSCRRQSVNGTPNSGNSNASPISSLAQSPTPKVWETVYFEAINQRSKEAGQEELRKVEIPSGSLEIRIWAGFDTTPLRGLLLRRTGDWSAMYVPPSKSSLISNKQPTVLSPPKSGWDSLWGKLNREDILTLPDAVDVGADNGDPDVLGIVIEIKSNHSYRAYNYNGFETSERAEAKKIVKICKIVSEEFRIVLC